MTKVARIEKLKIIEDMEDPIVELQGLIAEKEDAGVKDETYLFHLLQLEELAELLTKRN